MRGTPATAGDSRGSRAGSAWRDRRSSVSICSIKTLSTNNHAAQPASHPPARLADETPAQSHDSGACTAFALGWELASIHVLDFQAKEQPIVRVLGRLATAETLPDDKRLELAVQLLESNLERLMGRLLGGGHAPSSLICRLRNVIGKESKLGLDEAVEALHTELLFALQTADSKLGRAYALGHELAEITLWPEDEESFDDAFGTRATAIKDRLADLTSSFPPHSGRAVVLSLRAWESWAAEPALNGAELEWEKEGDAVKTALRRQGALWRDLLVGDKRGQDMLDTHHYVEAASSLFAKMFRTVVSFAAPIKWLLLALLALLLGGIALITFTGVKYLGGIFAVLGAVGLTGGTVRARLGHVTGHLQAELWGAELDRAIARAVLTGPTGWGMKIADVDVPASGVEPMAAANIATLRKFQQAAQRRSKRRLKSLLAADVEFVPGSGEASEKGQVEVLAWLMKDLHARQFDSAPETIEVIRQGILVVTTKKDGASVWRIREGKVKRWKGFADPEEAKTDARCLLGNGANGPAAPVR
jgi:hypothetical protein